MARDFLAYWKPSTLEAESAVGGLLNHAASNQYRRVAVGDTVWLVSVLDGRLRLIGRIIVGRIVDQAGAARELGTTNLWKADHHILPSPDTAHEFANLDVQHLASELRFMSAGGNDRLALAEDWSVNAQQLQTMRVLAPESVALLARVVARIA